MPPGVASASTAAGDPRPLAWLGATWRVAGTAHAALASLPALPPDGGRESDSPSGWQLVKKNAVRAVFRLATSPAAAERPTLYLKLFTDQSWRAGLRSAWRGRPEEREWQASRYAEKRGLSAARALALTHDLPLRGRRVGGLLLEGCDPARGLDEEWLALARDPHSRDAREDRRELAERLAELIAHAHQAGFAHVDLHPRNILVQRLRGGRLKLTLIDLAGARCGRPLERTDVAGNLAQLNQWFRRHASVPERLRWLRAYGRWRNEFECDFDTGLPLAGGFRGLVEQVRRAAEAHQRALWSKRDRRTADGRYFARIRVGAWRGLAFLASKNPPPDSLAARGRLQARDWQAALADPLRLLDSERAEFCKASHSAQVARVRLAVGNAELPVIVKRPLARNWRRRVRMLLGSSRARRGWQVGRQLLNRFQPAALPLVLLERRLGPLVLDNLLLTEVIPGALDLEAHLRREFGERSPRTWRAHKAVLAERLARQVRSLHEAGFTHHDCKAQNVLVVPGRPPRLVWIDMDGLRAHRRPPGEALQAAALARLAVSLENVPGLGRGDRVRFVKAYAARYGAGPAAWRQWWRRAANAAATKRTEHARHRDWKVAHYGRA